jgi:hypothetical protein
MIKREKKMFFKVLFFCFSGVVRERERVVYTKYLSREKEREILRDRQRKREREWFIQST